MKKNSLKKNEVVSKCWHNLIRNNLKKQSYLFFTTMILGVTLLKYHLMV